MDVGNLKQADYTLDFFYKPLELISFESQFYLITYKFAYVWVEQVALI